MFFFLGGHLSPMISILEGAFWGALQGGVSHFVGGNCYCQKILPRVQVTENIKQTRLLLKLLGLPHGFIMYPEMVRGNMYSHIYILQGTRTSCSAHTGGRICGAIIRHCALQEVRYLL